MASSTNGHDPNIAKILDVLLDMRKDLQKNTAEIVGVKDELSRLGNRIDNLLTGELGQKVRDHETRIERLEHDYAASHD